MTDPAWNAMIGLGWLVLMLVPFIFAQRAMHREVQIVFLLITHSQAIALVLFSLLLFPGVLLHELSHFIMARLLGVRTGRFSLIPGLLPDGKLRLGYVETGQSDVIRDSLIGLAPLVTGAAAVAYLGISRMSLLPVAAQLGQANWAGFWSALLALPGQTDFWLWFYLAFAISSAMLPSASDRRSWLPILLGLAILLGLVLLAGAGPWMLENISPWLGRAFRALATVFGISLVTNLVLLIPFRLIREFLLRVSGLRLEARR
jgi:hypothetical protein